MPGKVLRIYKMRAVFDNLETDNCLMASQINDAVMRGSLRNLEVCQREELPDMGAPEKVIPFEAIFGVYDFFSCSFVALVVESTSHLISSACSMRLVSKLIVVPLFGNVKLLSEQKARDEAALLKLLKDGLRTHDLYFSDVSDITHTQQRIAKLAMAPGAEAEALPLWKRADHRFFWNLVSVLDLIACDATQWVQPFMSAFVEFKPNCECGSEKFDLLLISRRSRYRQGCRFSRRGIDEHGHVANFVETEQVLIFPDGKVYAHAQVRGSIPVLWASPVTMKYAPTVRMETDLVRSAELCAKHITDLTTHYCDLSGNSGVIFVNLVDRKKDQQRLGQAFESVVESSRSRLPQTLKYVWYDFHAETKKKGKWDNLKSLVEMLAPDIRGQHFFSKDADGMVRSYQVGVFRTNCMDNLDRTNVVQSLVARQVLLLQLRMNKGSQLLSDLPTSSALGGKNKPPHPLLGTPWVAFEKTYKSVWTNNANLLSQLYAGTGALKVDFTKTGKRTITGMYNDLVNSLSRYFINNFTDASKQDAIDLMLGNYRLNSRTRSPFSPIPGAISPAGLLASLFSIVSVCFLCCLLVLSGLQFRTGDTGMRVLSLVLPHAVWVRHFLLSLLSPFLLENYLMVEEQISELLMPFVTVIMMSGGGGGGGDRGGTGGDRSTAIPSDAGVSDDSFADESCHTRNVSSTSSGAVDVDGGLVGGDGEADVSSFVDLLSDCDRRMSDGHSGDDVTAATAAMEASIGADVIVIPSPFMPSSGGISLESLSYCLFLSFACTVLLGVVASFHMFKYGSVLGERMARQPMLIHEDYPGLA